MTEFYGAFNLFDFAIPLAIPMQNGQTIKPTAKLLASHPAARATIHIDWNDAQGSGVIIAKRSTPININHIPISSLALTAGHLVGSSIRMHPCEYTAVHVGDEKISSDEVIALTIVDFSDLTANPQIDTCNGNEYALPNDLAIIAISHELNSNIEEMQIAEEFEPNEQIYVAGYPSKPGRILYCSPCLKQSRLDEAEKNIMDAFHKFEFRVISEGKAQMFSVGPNSLLSGDYSATSGVSGGPVFVLRDGKPQLMGINIGGCCLPQQFELAKILKLILENQWEKVDETLSTAISRMQNSQKYDPDLLKEFALLRKYIAVKGQRNSLREVLKCISATALHYTEPLDLNHNVAFPVWNPIFTEVRKAVNSFKNMPEKSYENVFEFYRDLIK